MTTKAKGRRGSDPEIHFNAGKLYTPEEDEYLLRYKPVETYQSLGMQMGRSPGSLAERYQRLITGKARRQRQRQSRTLTLIDSNDPYSRGLNAVIAKINNFEENYASLARKSGYSECTVRNMIARQNTPNAVTFFDIMAAAGVHYKMEVKE